MTDQNRKHVGFLPYLQFVRRKIFSALDSVLPRSRRIDQLFLLARFFHQNRRLPRNPTSPTATFNDLIFSRLARVDWNNRERFCVDKENAKIFVKGVCPELRTASIVTVIEIGNSISLDRIESALMVYTGERIVAKPTHG